jgi:SAM-dependent methyltransferase
VVALGLRRRGRRVVGLDLSGPMLTRARVRLGPVVVRSDAMDMAIASAGVDHAVSVWVVHAVSDSGRLFEEAARVVRPGGTYVVCSAQRPVADDRIGRIIDDMGTAVQARRTSPRPRDVTGDQVRGWAEAAGFSVTLHTLGRQWYESPSDVLAAIAHRAWPALRELDDAAVAEATGPAIAALKAMPEADYLRRATADVFVLRRP